MQKLTCLIFLISLYSCSGNHYHDGAYQANVFTDASLSWVRNEVIELNGTEVSYKSFSISDSSLQGELKTTCQQFEDRVEIKGKDGIAIVMRLTDDGNLEYGEYTYKRIN